MLFNVIAEMSETLPVIAQMLGKIDRHLKLATLGFHRRAKVNPQSHLLRPYLQASTESENQQHFDELIMVHAAPVVRQALRRRLGFYVDQSGTNLHNQVAENILAGGMTITNCAVVSGAVVRRITTFLTTFTFLGLVQRTVSC